MVSVDDLAQISIFSSLPAEKLHCLRPVIFERTFRQGAMLFLEGMRGGIMYIIKSGKIEVVKKKGPEHIVLATLGAGQLIGEMSVIDDEPRSASARVAEESTLYIVTKKCFHDLMRNMPEGANQILLAILKNVNQRLRETNRKLIAA